MNWFILELPIWCEGGKYKGLVLKLQALRRQMVVNEPVYFGTNKLVF